MRYVLLVILLYGLAIGMFLIPSCRSEQITDNTQRDAYLKMITANLQDKTYTADELEPTHYVPELPEIESADTGWSVEAETIDIPDGVKILRDRAGYSGIGYLGDLPEHTESALVIPITVPYTALFPDTLSRFRLRRKRFRPHQSGAGLPFHTGSRPHLHPCHLLRTVSGKGSGHRRTGYRLRTS